MSFFKSLAKLFGIGTRTTDNAYTISVRCDRCGEVIQGRINPYNDLSLVYEGNKTSFYCRKVIMGQGHCFQQIEVQLTFDAKRNLVERQISGGKFID